MAKTKEVVVTATEEQLAILDNAFPVEEQVRGPRLPRMGFLSKDITEETGTGKNKKIKIVQAAGTFFTEVETDEVEELENGKTRKVWEKTYLEDRETIDAVIFFHRKQLRMYDGVDNMFINTPIYDDNNEILPLFKGATEIDKGVPADLQAKYPALTQKGKPTSKLKEEKILYILFEGQVYQMNLSQSSKFAFLEYGRKAKINRVVTSIGSIEQTNGSNTYRVLTFNEKGPISKEDADLIVPKVVEMNDFIKAKKQRFTDITAANADVKELAEGKSKDF